MTVHASWFLDYIPQFAAGTVTKRGWNAQKWADNSGKLYGSWFSSAALVPSKNVKRDSVCWYLVNISGECKICLSASNIQYIWLGSHADSKTKYGLDSVAVKQFLVLNGLFRAKKTVSSTYRSDSINKEISSLCDFISFLELKKNHIIFIYAPAHHKTNGLFDRVLQLTHSLSRKHTAGFLCKRCERNLIKSVAVTWSSFNDANDRHTSLCLRTKNPNGKV